MQILAGLFLLFLLFLVFVAHETFEKLKQINKRLETLEAELRRLRSTPVDVPAAEKVEEPVRTPPPIPQELLNPPAPRVPIAPTPAINWEKFMAVNLFAWLGGFALFLAAAFFLKYSIDKNLIGPQIRVAIGSAVGIVLIGTGLHLQRKSYEVSAQTLCASGSVILYAVIYAAFSFYHFLSLVPAVILMSVVTAAVFLLAIRLNARFVAILGLLGGFLTPLVLSPVHGNTIGLFLYAGFLDAGLIAIAYHRKWNFLILLAAISTGCLQGIWDDHFVVSEFVTAILICAAFEILFLGAYFLFQRNSRDSVAVLAAAAIPPVVSFGFSIFFLGDFDVAARPLTVFAHIYLADLCLMAIPLIGKRAYWLQSFARLVVFAALASWTFGYINPSLLPAALFLYSVFALLHTAFPILLQPEVSGRKAPELKKQFSALSAILPFVLLALLVRNSPLNSFGSVFAVAFLLTLLLLTIAWFKQFDLLIAINLAAVLLLEYVWQAAHPGDRPVAMMWNQLFYLTFTVYPFFFYKKYASRMLAWRVAALSGPLHFYLIYKTVASLYGTAYIGLLPVAFCVAPLLGLIQRIRSVPFENPLRNSNLAWFAGALLFFITLIFPVQFDREWITIGWAMEGVALLWLFHKIPHSGLRLVGISLLTVAFFRLTINPEVLSYHARSNKPIFNWYFYTYGNVIGALLIGGKLLAPPRDKIRKTDVQALLYALAAILAFVLLNIEIADYFATGAVLTFQFSGNFARDTSYSIGWAAYALMLLVIGIRKKITSARYASIGLLSITLLKLFFHDLARLSQLYRVGALVGVALMLILASYLYQRFVSFEPKQAAE